MTKKEERLEEAQRLKRSWRERREVRRECEDEEEEHELEEEEMEKMMGQTDKFCHTCAMIPCCCALTNLERRIEMINLEKEMENICRELLENKEKQAGEHHQKPRLVQAMTELDCNVKGRSREQARRERHVETKNKENKNGQKGKLGD